MKGGKEWALVPLVLALASALLVLPIWLQGGTQGHDLFHHLLSGHYFARQLWQGELYPRWLMAMNGGFGSPTFFFYPPLPYYVSALFAGPVAPAQQAIYPLLGSATLALLLSGAFAYLWLRATTPPGRALAVSLLYLILPYHLAMDLYARFALAEFWAFAWAPLILLGQDLTHRGLRQGLPLLILGLALLAFSHLPSLLLMMGLVSVRALWFAWRSRTLAPCWIALGAQGLGLCMAAALLLPALADQGAISMELMRGGMFDFRRNFLDRLPSGWGDWRFRGHLAWQSLLTLALLLIAWAAAREPRHPELLCWGALGVGAFLMMLPLSQPLWSLLPPPATGAVSLAAQSHPHPGHGCRGGARHPHSPPLAVALVGNTPADPDHHPRLCPSCPPHPGPHPGGHGPRVRQQAQRPGVQAKAGTGGHVRPDPARLEGRVPAPGERRPPGRQLDSAPLAAQGPDPGGDGGRADPAGPAPV